MLLFCYRYQRKTQFNRCIIADQKKVSAQIKEPIPGLTLKEHHLQLAFGTINQLSSRFIENTIITVCLSHLRVTR